MTRSLPHTSAIFVLLLVQICTAEITAGKNPKAYTNRDFARDQFEFNRRTMSVAYLMAGKTDPAWDEAAVKYLDAFALRFTNAGEMRFILPGGTSEEELLRMGKQLIDAGCDDPLVLYCHAAGLDDSGDKAAAKPLIQRALTGLQNSEYPPYRTVSVAKRMRNHLDSEKEAQQYETCEKILLEQIVKMVASEECKGFGRREILRSILDSVEHSFAFQTRVYEAVAAQQTSEPWVMNSFAGNYHIDAAWESRGSGWAREVTEEGWKGFHKHLELARECLVKAWEIDPMLPEAPSRMITVTMGGHGVPNVDERTWFDRAVAAQFDYQPAYDHLMDAFMPRWGGSHKKMLEFAVECVETGRHDTSVPWQFIVWVEWINVELGNLKLWSSPAIYKYVSQICRGLDALPDFDANYANSFHAAAAWRAGQFDDAEQLIKKLGNDLDETAFARLRARPEIVRGHVAAMKSSAGKHVAEAEASWKSGKLEDAAESYQSAAESENLDPLTSSFIHNKTRQLQTLIPFGRGEWIELQPGKSLEGWRIVGGSWTVDEQGRLVGDSDTNGMRILLDVEFGRRFEFTGTVELLATNHPDNLNGGPIVAHRTDLRSYGYFLQKPQQETWMRCGYNHAERDAATIRDSNEFAVRAWDGVVSGDVNGQRTLKNYEMRHEVGDADDALIGVGAWHTHPGGKARFSNLKIRLLTEKP